MAGPSTTTPYSFIKRGNLFIIPVGPSIAEVNYPTQPHTKPREYSLWVNGAIEQPAFQLDHARMPPSLFQEVRNDLVRYSPVEVTRSAFQLSNHAYVGVIDSKGTPYYFALDSRGMSVREAEVDDERVWKTFDRLAEQEHMTAVRQRRQVASKEMVDVDRELSEPALALVIKAYHGGYKPTRVRSSWWRNLHEKKQAEPKQKTAKEPKQKNPPSHAATWREKYPDGKVARQYPRMKALTGDEHAGKLYASEMRCIGHILAIECDEEDLDPPREDDVDKALPKKSKESPTKKTSSKKASSKKVGAGGKPRYSYPNEKKSGSKPGGAKQQPLVVAADHDDSKHADPAELANQLGVSVRTLQHTAKRLGRDAFSKFMRSHLKRFAAKHRLDPDYWGTLYERLQTSKPPEPF